MRELCSFCIISEYCAWLNSDYIVHNTWICLCCTVCAANDCWIQFGGYSTNALAGRLLDCEASMLVVGGRCVATG